MTRLLGKKMVAIRRRSRPITRLAARRNRAAGPAYNTRGAVRMTARQLVDVDWDPDTAPAPPSAERKPDNELFQFAQQQIATIKGSVGEERDHALLALFEQVSRRRRRLSPTWLNAYQRIAVNYLNSGLGPVGDIACASFLLLTLDS